LPRTRILVADDFEPWRSFVRQVLARCKSFEVIGEATSGAEAVQKAEELQPDLILLDISMPELNGIEAARRIRAIVPESKILFLTLLRSSDIAREALDAGAQGYVIKTDAESELLPAIEAVLQGKQFISSRLED
jgi:DNA-binding NarL/FixJ family response regulator